MRFDKVKSSGELEELLTNTINRLEALVYTLDEPRPKELVNTLHNLREEVVTGIVDTDVFYRELTGCRMGILGIIHRQNGLLKDWS